MSIDTCILLWFMRCIKLQLCFGLLFQPCIWFSLFSLTHLHALKMFPSILTLAVVYLKVFISDQNQTETLFRADGVFLNFSTTFWRPTLFKFIYLFNGIFKFIHYITLGVYPWVWLRPKLRNVECRLSYVVEVGDRRGVVWIRRLQYKY